MFEGVGPGRARRAGIAVVGVSGPDGAGKSGLVAGLRESMTNDGAIVGTVYVYGCVVCRRAPRAAGDILKHSVSPRSAALPRSIARFVSAIHAFADAAELTLRVAAAATSLAIRAHRLRSGDGRAGRPILLTDRSPLDGLAKHLPPGRSLTWRAYHRVADRYQGILLLSAPPEVLAVRDGEHDEPALSAAAARFDLVAGSLPAVVRIDTGDKDPESVLAAARATLDQRLARGATDGVATRRPDVADRR